MPAIYNLTYTLVYLTFIITSLEHSMLLSILLVYKVQISGKLILVILPALCNSCIPKEQEKLS
jgi:hypothetical protein